jgi:hypothetical protein
MLHPLDWHHALAEYVIIITTRFRSGDSCKCIAYTMYNMYVVSSAQQPTLLCLILTPFAMMQQKGAFGHGLPSRAYLPTNYNNNENNYSSAEFTP